MIESGQEIGLTPLRNRECDSNASSPGCEAYAGAGHSLAFGQEEVMGTYIHNLATSFIGELGIKTIDIGETGRHGQTLLWDCFSPRIKTKLSRMRPETLGRIAACGREAPDWNLGRLRLGGEAYPTPLLSLCGVRGINLLIIIACVAIVTEMNVILVARKKREYNESLADVMMGT